MASHWRAQDGPPMIPHGAPPKRKKQRRDTKKKPQSEVFPRYVHPTPLDELQGPAHLVASALPEGFPPEMAFRALAAYSLLRTLSCELRLSPFTPNVFLRALILSYPNRLLGQIHVSLLRVLLPALRMGYSYRERGGILCVSKKRRGGSRWELRAGDNLTFLDGFTWPLFYDDYVHLTADDIWARMHDDELYADFKNNALRDAPTDVLPTRSITVAGTAFRPQGQMLPTRGTPATGKKVSQLQPRLARNGQVPVDSDSEANDSGSEFGASDVEQDDEEDFEAKPRAKRKRRSTTKQKGVSWTLKVNPSAKKDYVNVSASHVEIPSRSTHALGIEANVRIVTSAKPWSGALAPRPSSIDIHATTLSGQRIAAYVTEMSRDGRPLRHFQQAPSLGSTRQPGLETGEPSAKRMKGMMPCSADATAPYYYPRHFPDPHALGQVTPSSSHRSRPLATPVLPNVGTMNGNQSHGPTPGAGQAMPQYPREAPKPPNGAAVGATQSNHSNNPTSIAGQAMPSFPYGSKPLATPMLPNVAAVNAKQSHKPTPGTGHAPPPPSPQHGPRSLTTPVLPYAGQMNANQSQRPTPIAGRTTPSYAHVAGPLAAMVPNPGVVNANQGPTQPMTIPVLPHAGTVNANRSHKPTPIAGQATPWHPQVAGPLVAMEPNTGAGNADQGPTQPMTISMLKNAGTVNADQSQKPTPFTGQVTSSYPRVAGSLVPKPPNAATMSTAHAYVTTHDVVPAPCSSVPQRPYSSITNGNPVNPVQNIHTYPFVAPVVPRWMPTVKVAPYDLPSWKPVPDLNAHFVSSKAADTLHNYLAGRFRNSESDKKGSSEQSSGTVGEDQGRQVPGNGQAETSEDEGNDTHASFPDTYDEWPQFTPVESMRNGVPYHRLQLEHKMAMLEFLLDELLTVDFVAAEFTRRDAKTSCFGYPYGALPTKKELESIENEDECGLCGLEGELLCCDGCIRSYHRQCIGMKGTHLTEDKWLCPECTTIDPCQFGPLREGRKSSLDWFTLSDVKLSETIGTESQSASPLTSSIPCGSSMGMKIGLHVPKSNDHLESDSIASNSVAEPIPSELKDSEFLVVHGFLFLRPLTDHCDKRLHSMETEEYRKHDFWDRLPSTRDEVYGILQRIGHSLSCSWPLSQIPLEPSKVWSFTHEPDRSNYFSRYFLLRVSFDPSSYLSQYRMAPLPPSMQVGKGSKRSSLVLSDFESECSSSDMRALSNVLTRDMSQDFRVAKSLQSSTYLFSPYQMMSLYLVRLEASFRRAYLLDENWGIRKGKYDPLQWSREVTECRTIQSLAKKMVDLVDSCHSRVFLGSWFDVSSPVQGGKDGQGQSDSFSLTASSDPRTYESLPFDWTADGEMACRRWQRASDSNILSLLSGGSIRLGGIVEGVKPTIANRRGRKNRILVTFERQRNSEEALNDQKRQPSVARDDRDKVLASPGGGPFVEAKRRMNASDISTSVDRLFTAAKSGFEESGTVKPVVEPSTSYVKKTDAEVLTSSHPAGLVAIQMPSNPNVSRQNFDLKPAAEASAKNTEKLENDQVNSSQESSISNPNTERATLQAAEETKREEGCPSQKSLILRPAVELIHSKEGLENDQVNPSRESWMASSIVGRADIQYAEGTKSEEGCPPEKSHKSKSVVEPAYSSEGLENDQVNPSQESSIASPIAGRATLQVAEETKSEEVCPPQEPLKPAAEPTHRTEGTKGSQLSPYQESSFSNIIAERATIQAAEETKGEEGCPLQEFHKSKPVVEPTHSMEGRENDQVNYSWESSIARPMMERATPQAAEETKREEGCSPHESPKSKPAVEPSRRPYGKNETKKLRTRTRRSGRLHRNDFSDTFDSLASGPGVSSESVFGDRVAPRGDKTRNSDQATRLEYERRTRLAKLEELIANPTEKRTHWPIAGRKLFDPVGYLPPSEIQRLGRNAGALVAPYVLYSSSYEVGEVSVYHSWRKRCLKVQSFEDLLMQMRVLDSFIDKPVLHSCETLARRTPKVKSQVQKVIRCKQRDLKTGRINYFVVKKGKHRGCWLDSDSIDLSSFILERSNCIDAKLKCCDQQEKKDETQRGTVVAGTVPKAECPPSRSTFVECKPTFAECKSSRPTLSLCKSEISTAVMQHQIDTENLIICCKEVGFMEVPISELSKLRSKNALRLKEIYSQLHEGQSPPPTEESRILSLLCMAEEQATIYLRNPKTKLLSKVGHSTDNFVKAKAPHFSQSSNTGAYLTSSHVPAQSYLPRSQYVGAPNPYMGNHPEEQTTKHLRKMQVTKGIPKTKLLSKEGRSSDNFVKAKTPHFSQSSNTGEYLTSFHVPAQSYRPRSQYVDAPNPYMGNIPEDQATKHLTKMQVTKGIPKTKLLSKKGHSTDNFVKAKTPHFSQSSNTGEYLTSSHVPPQSYLPRNQYVDGPPNPYMGTLPPNLCIQSLPQQQALGMNTQHSHIALTQTTRNSPAPYQFTSQQLQPPPNQQLLFHEAQFLHHSPGFNANMQNQVPNRFNTDEPGWNPMPAASNERVGRTSRDLEPRTLEEMQYPNGQVSFGYSQDLEPRTLEEMQHPSGQNSFGYSRDLEPLPLEEVQHPNGQNSFGYGYSGDNSNWST